MRLSCCGSDSDSADQLKAAVSQDECAFKAGRFGLHLAILFFSNVHDGTSWAPPSRAASATAVLVQPNLDVGGDNDWAGPGEWDKHIARFHATRR